MTYKKTESMAIYTASTDAELLEYTATNRGQKTR